MLPSARIVGFVRYTLFRSGNATSPQLAKVRPAEQLPCNLRGLVFPPPYHKEWDVGKFPGVSTFDAPFYTSGRLWAYEANNAIPADLMVFNDMICTPNETSKLRHFAWLPDVEMKNERYLMLLGEAQKALSPPLIAGAKDSWTLLPKSIVPQNGGTLKPIPESIFFTSRHILNAIAAQIVLLEHKAAELGDANEGLELSEEALWMRNWYHTYLNTLLDSSASYIPTMNMQGLFARSYHTIINRPTQIPEHYVSCILEYANKLRIRAEKLYEEGKEDESLDISDQLLLLQNAAMNRKAP